MDITEIIESARSGLIKQEQSGAQYAVIADFSGYLHRQANGKGRKYDLADFSGF